MGNIKEVTIKNRTCYFFNDKIIIEDFNLNYQTRSHTERFIILDTSQLKLLAIVKVLIV